MSYYQELANASPQGGTAVTIGTFDGVHLGHQRLFQHLNTVAETHNLVSTVVTFRDSPRLVLGPGAEVQYLTTLEERLALVKAQGVGLVVPIDFSKELSLLAAREFVSLLCEHLKMKGIVAGPDFALGHNREGDIAALKALGEDMDFWVETVEHVLMGQGAISSNSLRRTIAQGDVESASKMLGRWYTVAGVVVEGDRRGAPLGFPTANLAVPGDLVIPADGIYATWAIVDGTRHQAASCIGVRPTFGGGRRTVEAYLLDFQGDLYGRTLTLEFAARLRAESAFPSVDALVEQMRLDVEQTRDALSNAPGAFKVEV